MFPPLVIGDCQAVVNPPAIEYADPISGQRLVGSLDGGVRYGDFVVRLLGRPLDAEPAGEPAAEPPDPDFAVDVSLRGDNQGEGGTWYQTFVFTIRPAGTLADVSTIVFGDESGVAELFPVVQKRYPDISSPELVQAGQELEITVDASRTNVLKTVIPGGSPDALTRVYYNGVKETIPGKTGSAVVRSVEFPANAPVDTFTFRRGEQELTMPKGNKLVEYRYEQGDSFEETVRASYGTLSARAIQDFERQTAWVFNRWPPASGDTAEAIISMTRSYEDEAFQPLKITLPDPIVDAKFQELLDQRAKAGIYPVKQPPGGISYRVTVVDSSVTARQVARLIFNSDARYLEVAEAAGVRLETKDPTKIPADFDVPLIGRSFDLQVDYADEDYVLEVVEGGGENIVKTTKLLNGTVIHEHKAAGESLQGMHKTVYYPNGYRRLVYKPDDTLVALFDFVYFTMKIGQVDNDEDRRGFIATMLWNWLRDIPRSPGDVAEQLSLRDTGQGKIMEALVWQRDSIGLAEMILYRWWTLNPCMALLAVVFGASAVFMLMVILIRKTVGQRYP